MFVFVLFVFLLFNGCAFRQFIPDIPIPGFDGAAPVAATAVYFARGDLEADLVQDVRAIYEASLRALLEQGYEVRRQELRFQSAVIEANNGGNDGDVRLVIRNRGDRLTHVSVRSGLLGDEERSRRVLEQIQQRLSVRTENERTAQE